MRLTKTQLNFRKQMKNFKEKPDIYNTTRTGSPFSNIRKHKVSIGGILSALFLAPLIYGIIHHFALTATKPENNNVFPTTNVTTSSLPVANSSLKRNVSRTDAASIDQLKTIIAQINNNRTNLSEQHKIPWNQRNIDTYKSVLLKGVVISEQELHILSSIKISSRFQPLVEITRNLLLNSKYAYSHYLNYLNTHNPTEIDLGNNYLQLANQNSQEYIQTLVKILEDNNYSYNFDGNTVHYTIDNN